MSEEAIAKLDALVDGMDTADATLVLLKWLFVKCAEIEGDLTALVPVIGAMAGRLGIKRDEVRILTARTSS